MNEVAPLQAQASLTPPTAPSPGGLGWFLSGFVLPLGSRPFYRLAARQSVGRAILFFLVFSILAAIVLTVSVVRALNEVQRDIAQAYADGDLPVITIERGNARVDVPQPFYFENRPSTWGGGFLMAIDTTGKLKTIDRSRYESGILLTRTDIQILSNGGRFQTLPLGNINEMYGDPLVMDAESMGQLWSTVTGIAAGAGFVGLLIWNFGVGLGLLAALAFVMWGFTLLLRRGTPYGMVLAVGIYAAVPALYLAHLLGRVGVDTSWRRTLMLVACWALGLILGLGPGTATKPRLWTALFGLPLLAAIAYDVIWPIPYEWAPWALWGLLVITVLLLVGIPLMLDARERETPAPGGQVPA